MLTKEEFNKVYDYYASVHFAVKSANSQGVYFESLKLAEDKLKEVVALLKSRKVQGFVDKPADKLRLMDLAVELAQMGWILEDNPILQE